MDVTVRPMAGGKGWSLIDLLGRPMGRITEDPPKHFTIHPDGKATETMAGLSPGPFASLDLALSEIETHTRGVCRTRRRWHAVTTKLNLLGPHAVRKIFRQNRIALTS